MYLAGSEMLRELKDSFLSAVSIADFRKAKVKHRFFLVPHDRFRIKIVVSKKNVHVRDF